MTHKFERDNPKMTSDHKYLFTDSKRKKELKGINNCVEIWITEKLDPNCLAFTDSTSSTAIYFGDLLQRFESAGEHHYFLLEAKSQGLVAIMDYDALENLWNDSENEPFTKSPRECATAINNAILL